MDRQVSDAVLKVLGSVILVTGVALLIVPVALAYAGIIGPLWVLLSIPAAIGLMLIGTIITIIATPRY